LKLEFFYTFFFSREFLSKKKEVLGFDDETELRHGWLLQEILKDTPKVIHNKHACAGATSVRAGAAATTRFSPSSQVGVGRPVV
jgi:hypothetical protein